MKIRRSLFWLVGVMAVTIVVLLWFGRKRQPEIPPTESIETNVAPQVTSVLSAPARMSSDSNTPQATRDGALSSASRFTSFGPACLSLVVDMAARAHYG
jgi:hypothetical protein